MKKLLGIIVLSLLLSGNAYAERAKPIIKNSESIIFQVKTGTITDKMLSYQISTAKQHCKSFSYYLNSLKNAFWLLASAIILLILATVI